MDLIMSKALKEEGYDALIIKDGKEQHLMLLDTVKDMVKKMGEKDTHKESQLEIIKKSNPMLDDIHTGIRSIKDILTFKEAVSNKDNLVTSPDYAEEDIEKALKIGEIEVFSSYEIKNGIFVTPSRMEAETYAGGGEVYSKVVKLEDVAWIDSYEGQYALVKLPIKKKEYKPIVLGKRKPVEVKLDNYMREFMEDRKIYITQKGVRSTYGNYDHAKREIYIRSRLSGDMKESLLHEVGHSVDYMNVNTSIFKNNSIDSQTISDFRQEVKRNKLSLTKTFESIWRGERNYITLEGGQKVYKRSGVSKGAENIVKKRLSRTLKEGGLTITDDLLDKAYRGNRIDLDKNKFLRNSTKYRTYIKSSEEVFAEGWGQYLLNPKEFKNYAPEFFNYFEEINNLIEETYG